MFKSKVFPVVLLPVNIITIELGEGPGKAQLGQPALKIQECSSEKPTKGCVYA